MKSIAPWICVLVLWRACENKFDFSLTCWCQGPVHSPPIWWVRKVSNFTHPTPLRGKRQTVRRGKRQNEMLRMPCRNQGDITQSPVTYCIPAQLDLSVYSTPLPTSVGCDELDILICRPLLVLFPLLGVPLCITELFQGPCQRLAVLWILDPLIFCWSNYFKYQHSYHRSLWIGFGGSISTPGGYLRNLCVCAHICYSGEEVRASTTFSKRFCDSKKD